MNLWREFYLGLGKLERKFLSNVWKPEEKPIARLDHEYLVKWWTYQKALAHCHYGTCKGLGPGAKLILPLPPSFI